MYKRLIINIITMIFVLNTIFIGVGYANPRITADAAAVIDLKSGQVVYDKNGTRQRAFASLTKMMTAILAVEFGDLKQDVTASQRAALTLPSKMHLRKGEVIKLEYLLKAALMRSANDACVAIAEHVGGQEEYFVYMMNLKAWSIGLTKTNFMNTNGLPASKHLSSAVDMAKIGVYCKRNPIITQVVSKKDEVIIRRGQEQKINNTNKLLWSYPGANGIKTGTTNAAGNCLASSAANNDNAYVGVVLHSDNRYGDSIKILDYAFSNFSSQEIMSAQNTISVEEGKIKLMGSVRQDIYYPYSLYEKTNTYVVPYGLQKDIKKGQKCGLLAVVTSNAILWYDIYAVEDKQILTNNYKILDKIYNYFRH